MILSPGALLRVGLLLFVSVVLQLSVLSKLGIVGGHIDLDGCHPFASMQGRSRRSDLGHRHEIAYVR